MAQLVLPRVQAMVLCDAIDESEYENEVFDLGGVRTVIESSFPAVVSRFCVFLHLSGHHGEARCHVEIEHIDASEVIFQSGAQTVAFDSPDAVVPVVFRLPDCVFPAEGVYYVQVFNEKKLIGERPLILRSED